MQSVTFHLADSLPREAVESPDTDPTDRERLHRSARYLDAGHGAGWLRQPQIVVVEETLLHFDGLRYRLLCWVMMPNHVHTLIQTRADHPLPTVVHSWKSFTAKEVNRRLGLTGMFWARDYFDRYLRDDQHWAAVIRYIECNPVRVGLAARPEDWPYGSAARRSP